MHSKWGRWRGFPEEILPKFENPTFDKAKLTSQERPVFTSVV